MTGDILRVYCKSKHVQKHLKKNSKSGLFGLGFFLAKRVLSYKGSWASKIIESYKKKICKKKLLKLVYSQEKLNNSVKKTPYATRLRDQYAILFLWGFFSKSVCVKAVTNFILFGKEMPR